MMVGFTIPFGVALNNVVLGITLLAWLCASGARDKLLAFRAPVAVPALALVGLLVVGCAYGTADAAAALQHLKKYSDLALIPVLLFLFREPRIRQQSILAFAASLAIVLALSYLLKTGLLPGRPWFLGNTENPVVFKYHLTHNILMAFGVFLFAWLALVSVSARSRLAWGALSVLALINVTLMVHGATGYLVLAALLLLLVWQRSNWIAPTIAAISAAVLTGALLVHGNAFEERVARITTEVEEWRPDQPAQSSPGLRLEFYRNTLSIIADHPLTGVGTGGFAQAYAEKVKGTGKVATHNPHNEFLLMWSQLGIAGVALLIWLFWRQWRLAAHLPTRLERELARGLILTMVIGCMLNSLLLDHTEGLFYAWLTGVLYGGLRIGDSTTHRQAAKAQQAGNAVR